MGRWKQVLSEANIKQQLRALHRPCAQMQLIPAPCLLQRATPALAALEISSILGTRENILTPRVFAACGNCDSFACPRTSCSSVQHKETIIRIVMKLQFAGVCLLSATTRCDGILAPFATDDFSLILRAELLGRNVKKELGGIGHILGSEM